MVVIVGIAVLSKNYTTYFSPYCAKYTEVLMWAFIYSDHFGLKC